MRGIWREEGLRLYAAETTRLFGSTDRSEFETIDLQTFATVVKQAVDLLVAPLGVGSPTEAQWKLDFSYSGDSFDMGA